MPLGLVAICICRVSGKGWPWEAPASSSSLFPPRLPLCTFVPAACTLLPLTDYRHTIVFSCPSELMQTQTSHLPARRLAVPPSHTPSFPLHTCTLHSFSTPLPTAHLEACRTLIMSPTQTGTSLPNSCPLFFHGQANMCPRSGFPALLLWVGVGVELDFTIEEDAFPLTGLGWQLSVFAGAHCCIHT